ncbi:Nucleoid-associated protein YgaU, contains BON and LysM domains [Yoonia rosea]|uniref:Nucleoid-associated protein YgaU, contains BON and LysM domains n=1 Tax=Yoonia rosea TaxID=287098 RepID=A0A1R3WQG9_9RHOB|nr:LysM peptidoglycan-binding domain-containing protein [Yoonia rosea]SIT80440.1 Nucleoid-associated protein YgaU, contains BON and LysM domains [Yoonia rosea]
MEENVKSGAKPVVLGSLAAMAIGVLIFLMMPQADVGEPPADIVAETPVVTPAAAAPEPAPEVVAEAPEPEQAQQVPEFDTFRVEHDGSMVIAGRAQPGQTVDVILAGEAIDRVIADSVGNFVSLPVAGPAAQPRRLSLLADPEGEAVASTTSYMVAPIAAPVVIAAAEDPAPAVTEAAPQAPVDPAQVATVDTPSVASPQAPTVPDADLAPAAPVAPTVLQADADGVRVVQASPTLATPEARPNVALDAITYDPEGEVQLSGRATGDGAVQVYIDNEPVTASPVTEGGDWRIDLPDIATGVYTLRIDEVDTEGGVVSRLETPFRREEAADVAAVLAEETAVEGFEVAVRTVQPGATLWAIAEENLGAGIFYVEVFEANRDLIRDPDLIYPGQIFRIPEITQ